MEKGPRARFGKILLKLSLLGEVSPSFIEKCFFKGGLENISEDFNGHSPMSSTSGQSEETTNNKSQSEETMKNKSQSEDLTNYNSLSENKNVNKTNENEQSDQDKETVSSKVLKLNGKPIKEEVEEIIVEISPS